MVLVLEESIICETVRTFLDLTLLLIVSFVVVLFVVFYFFLRLEKGSAKKLLSGTQMSVFPLKQIGSP